MALTQAQGDPRLVAVGEIGLDFFEAGLDPRGRTGSLPRNWRWRAGTGCQ